MARSQLLRAALFLVLLALGTPLGASAAMVADFDFREGSLMDRSSDTTLTWSGGTGPTFSDGLVISPLETGFATIPYADFPDIQAALTGTTGTIFIQLTLSEPIASYGTNSLLSWKHNNDYRGLRLKAGSGKLLWMPKQGLSIETPVSEQTIIAAFSWDSTAGTIKSWQYGQGWSSPLSGFTGFDMLTGMTLCSDFNGLGIDHPVTIQRLQVYTHELTAQELDAVAGERSGIIFEDDFEAGLDVTSTWNLSVSASGAGNGQTEVRDGSLCYKATLTRIDANSYRDEIRNNLLWIKSGEERWIGFWMYFPSGYSADNVDEILFQLHGKPDAGEDWRSPPLALGTENGQFKVWVRADSKAITPPPGTPDRYTVDDVYYNLGAVPQDAWVKVVLHTVYDYADSNGVVELWIDDAKVLDHRSGVGFNDVSGGYLKFGIYKWPWKWGTSNVNSRTVYYDDIRVGDERSDYFSVAPN